MVGINLGRNDRDKFKDEGPPQTCVTIYSGLSIAGSRDMGIHQRINPPFIHPRIFSKIKIFKLILAYEFNIFPIYNCSVYILPTSTTFSFHPRKQIKR